MKMREYALGVGLRADTLCFVSTYFLVGFVGIVVMPFYIYIFGAELFWNIIGMVLCMMFVWYFESYSLMRYARKDETIISLPGYFSHRFRDRRDYLRVMASCEIAVLSIMIMALVLRETALVFSGVTGIDSGKMELIIVILVTIVIGFNGMSVLVKTSTFKAIFSVTIVGLTGYFMYSSMGINQMVRNMMATDITGSVTDYINIIFHNGELLPWQDVVSFLSMGILISGIPFFLSSFFNAPNPRTINKAKRMMLVYVLVLFTGVAVMGTVSRGFLYEHKITSSLSEYVKLMYDGICKNTSAGKTLGIGYMILLAMAFLSIIEGSLKETVTVIYDDILRRGRLVRIKGRNNSLILFITATAVMVVVYLVNASLREMSINTILVFIGALGCSISPTIILSLFWKKMNKFGCMAGLVSGLIGVPFFKYATLIKLDGDKLSLCDVIGINSVLPAMAFTFLMIVFVSMITPRPSKEIVDEFMEVKNRIV